MLVVSRFFSSVIRPKGQRDDPRLIGGTRQRLEQVRFIGSQGDAVPIALAAIILEALHQFAGPRARAGSFHIVCLVGVRRRKTFAPLMDLASSRRGGTRRLLEDEAQTPLRPDPRAT